MQLFGLQGGLAGLQGLQGGAGPVGGPPAGAAGTATARAPITAQLQPGVHYRPGQYLFGQVAGRQGEGFLLRFGGSTLSARSNVPLEVGQSLQVQVQGQEQGQLRLQVVKSPFTAMSDGQLSSALSGLKLPVSDESLALAKTMVEHGVPLTRENFASLRSVLAQVSAQGGGQAQALPQQVQVGAAWFLQCNHLPVSPQNVTALGAFIAANPQLGAQLFALQGELRRMAESPGRQSRRALDLLAEVPGILGEYLLEPTSQERGGKAGRRLFDLARQAGIETHVGVLGGGGEQDWDLVAMLRRLRAALAGEARLQGALGLVEGLEEHLRALQLINQARPDAFLGFYYLQVPLRVEQGESAEVWIRFSRDEEGERTVDPEDCRIEFRISTEHLGELVCTLDVKGRTVHLDLGAASEEVRSFVESGLPVLVERLAGLGWSPRRVGCTLRPFQERPLVEHQDFATLETVNVQA